MTKIKIDVDTAVHSVLKCFTPEKRRNATLNCTTAMRQKERCRSLLTTTMSILALSVVSTLPAKLMRWCTLTFATKYTTLTCASAFFCDNLWCNWLECTKHFDVTLFFEDERLEEAHRVVLAGQETFWIKKSNMSTTGTRRNNSYFHVFFIPIGSYIFTKSCSCVSYEDYVSCS